jgi:hypothetical protein
MTCSRPTIGDGSPDIHAIEPPDTPAVAFAAEELQAYLGTMTGVEVPITEHPHSDPAVGDDTPNGNPDDVHSGAVLVGREDALEVGVGHLRGTLAGESEDAYAIQSVDGGVVCGGVTPRATLYAVYDLLERLGVRFFAPDFDCYEGHAEVVPERETVTLPELDATVRPAMDYRKKYVEEGISHTTETLATLVDWMAKARLNVLVCPMDYRGLGVRRWDDWREAIAPELERRGLLLEVGGHGFESFLPESEYPTFYAEDGNVFDLAKDDAVDAYVETVAEYLHDRPEIDVFSAWPPDAASWPSSVIDAFGSAPNAYGHVVDRLRRHLDETMPVRDLTVEAIAYSSHVEPPDPEYAFPADGTLVDVAPVGPDGTHRSLEATIFDPGSGNAVHGERFRGWREVYDGPLSAYTYYRKYSWHSLPILLPELIGTEVEQYAAAGADGLGSYSEPADWLTYELNHLLAARLAWTPEESERVLEDYLADRFGDAADAMAAYLETVEPAGRSLFRDIRAEYDDPDVVAGVLEAFREAREHLQRASEATPEASAASFVIDRLLSNVEYAIADTESSYYALQDDPEAAADARERVARLIDEHARDGIVLRSKWAVNRTLGPDENWYSVESPRFHAFYDESAE